MTDQQLRDGIEENSKIIKELEGKSIGIFGRFLRIFGMDELSQRKMMLESDMQGLGFRDSWKKEFESRSIESLKKEKIVHENRLLNSKANYLDSWNHVSY